MAELISLTLDLPVWQYNKILNELRLLDILENEISKIECYESRNNTRALLKTVSNCVYENYLCSGRQYHQINDALS